MYEYIDIHAHLGMKDFDEDREDLIKKLQVEKICVITVGVDKQSSFETVALANKYENIFATIGFHPTDTKENFVGSDFLELVKNPKVVSIGECGLDFFRLEGDFTSESKKQIDNFSKQIDFAAQFNKPLMIHCRNAHKEVLDILTSKKREFGDSLQGNIHFFSGDVETAKQYLSLDFSLSFGGVLTFTSDYDDVVKFVPIKKIMSETDAPFVAPVPYRRQRNSSLYVKEVVKRIAEIRGGDYIQIKENLVQNAIKAFSLS